MCYEFELWEQKGEGAKEPAPSKPRDVQPDPVPV